MDCLSIIVIRVSLLLTNITLVKKGISHFYKSKVFLVRVKEGAVFFGF